MRREIWEYIVLEDDVMKASWIFGLIMAGLVAAGCTKTAPPGGEAQAESEKVNVKAESAYGVKLPAAMDDTMPPIWFPGTRDGAGVFRRPGHGPLWRSKLSHGYTMESLGTSTEPGRLKLTVTGEAADADWKVEVAIMPQWGTAAIPEAVAVMTPDINSVEIELPKQTGVVVKVYNPKGAANSSQLAWAFTPQAGITRARAVTPSTDVALPALTFMSGQEYKWGESAWSRGTGGGYVLRRAFLPRKTELKVTNAPATGWMVQIVDSEELKPLGQMTPDAPEAFINRGSQTVLVKVQGQPGVDLDGLAVELK